MHHISGTVEDIWGYDHDFWYTCVKWYLLVFFSFCHFFENFIFGAVKGGGGVGGGAGGGEREGKNSPKWKITITSIMHYISGTV